MRNLATKRSDVPEVLGETGTVVRRDGDVWVVRGAQGPVTSARAASCLVEPLPGDRVLVATTEEGERFVLAVLRRADPTAPTALTVEGDLRLETPGGRVEVRGRDGVALSSSKDVSFVAEELRVAAASARTTIGDLVHVGATLLAQVDATKVVGAALDVVVDRAVSRVKRAFRFVEESDTLRAGDVDYRARSVASIQGEHAVVTAEKLVKVDGAQVHIG